MSVHATPSHTSHSKRSKYKRPHSTASIRNHQVGTASWYGGRDIGRLTANGERYHRMAITAAHRKLPFNTRVLVTNLKNGKTVVVRINDRGPYVKGRIIDLSLEAAKRIDLIQPGLTQVHLQILDSSWNPV